VCTRRGGPRKHRDLNPAAPRGAGAHAWVALAALCLLPAAPVSAGEGDTLRPFVEASLAYDTNLFRFADDAEALASSLGDPIRSVVFQRYGAGVHVDWRQSRQRVVGRLGANQTRYNHYSRLLDHSGYDLRGEWLWQMGERWSGSLLLGQEYAQQPYSDRVSGVIRNNLRTNETRGFQAEYWFHADWRARVRLDTFNRAYDENAQRFDNYRTRTATLGLYTQGNTIERLGIEYIDARNEYYDRPLFATLDNESDEQSLRLVASWAASGKTTVSGYLGHARRDYPNLNTKGFQGMEGRLGVRWLPTGKTVLDAAVQRDLGESGDPGVNFRRVDSASLNATWRALPKTRLMARARYAREDYDGISRQDDLLSSTLSASYEAWPGGDISAGWEYSRRDSDLASQEYRAGALFLSAHLKF